MYLFCSMFLGISFACKIIYLSFYFRFLYNEKLDEGGGTINLGYPPFPVIKMESPTSQYLTNVRTTKRHQLLVQYLLIITYQKWVFLYCKRLIRQLFRAQLTIYDGYFLPKYPFLVVLQQSSIKDIWLSSECVSVQHLLWYKNVWAKVAAMTHADHSNSAFTICKYAKYCKPFFVSFETNHKPFFVFHINMFL